MTTPYKIQHLPLAQLHLNPKNPRLIKDAAFRNLVKSLSDCPTLFDARPCICSDRTGQNIILGGNMRYLAAKELKYKTVPAIIMTGLTEAQEREITIKDNGDFGEWDFDILSTEWTDLPLEEWGINYPQQITTEKIDLEYREIELKPYKMSHVLLSFPPEKLLEIQEYLEKIIKIEGVEYEQSSN